MNILIDWGKVYDIAKSTLTKEEFLKISETFGKIEESAPIQKFMGYMEQYQKKVLPSLLQSSQASISPEKFVNIVVNQVKKDSKLLDAFMSNPSSMFASILFGAEIGLVPSDEIGEFFLISRNMKQNDGTYNKTLFEITLTNGSIIQGIPGSEPERYRGKQFHGAWFDELCAFEYLDDAYDQVQFTLRLKHPGIERVQQIITTTPKVL